MTDVRRALPAIHTLLGEAEFAPLLARAPRTLVLRVLRATVERVRGGALPTPASHAEWAALIADALDAAETPSLRRVINATGVVLHTNLGRAPLAPAALDAMTDAARGYVNLEYDLERGDRGSRLLHARDLICELTGAEDALVVNNCAAALVLALRALSGGRDVLVSRGELIEIGGSFRVPEIMAESGARLVEVGTTNRTHLDDYRRALSPETGAIVKVHRSNFTMAGFVADVPARDLAAIAAEGHVALVHDFGSGLLMDLSPWGLSGEPAAAEVVASGADVVLMSGDKLLGGPQAGIIAGRRAAVAQMRTHPLARALRVDKLTLAALEATLALYRDPTRAVREIPTLAMLTVPGDAVRAHAEALAARINNTLGSPAARVVATQAAVGGGAFPNAQLASWAVALTGSADAWDRALRGARTPVVGRIADGALVLDARTVLAADDDALVAAVAVAWGAGAGDA